MHEGEKETMKFSAILFDMDGVLVDTEPAYYERRKNFLREFYDISIEGMDPRIFIGGNTQNIWQFILKEDIVKYDLKKLNREYLEYKKKHKLDYANLLVPEAREILKIIKENQIKTALASNSTLSDIEIMLKETQLEDYFDVVLSGEMVSEKKPSPAVYLKACEMLDVEVSEALVVEDSEKGIEAGKQANATVWAIKDTHFGLNQDKSDKIIKNLKELHEIFSLKTSQKIDYI